MVIVFIGYAVIFCVISTIQLHFSKSYMTLSGVNSVHSIVCGMRGYANYFGVDAKYSDSYVHWLPNKHR